MRNISSVACIAAALLLGEAPLVFANNSQVFAGHWHHQSSLGAACNGCIINIVQHGSALLLLTNMGWGTAIEADRTGLATYAEGRAIDADGQWWAVSCIVTSDRLYIIATANDASMQLIKSVFIPE
jgi:hypothetical protein